MNKTFNKKIYDHHCFQYTYTMLIIAIFIGNYCEISTKNLQFIVKKKRNEQKKTVKSTITFNDGCEFNMKKQLYNSIFC